MPPEFSIIISPKKMTKQSPAEFIESFNRQYEAKHKAYENSFWARRMNLKSYSQEVDLKTKAELDQFLGDKQSLEQVQAYLKTDLSPEYRNMLLFFVLYY
jgi:Tfp pilus assembly protein PilF